MTTNREIVASAYEAWMNDTGSIASIFDPGIEFEITGLSAISRTYTGTQDFSEHVLQPVGARFAGSNKPFRPVRVRGVYDAPEENTVVVIWEGEGITRFGSTYRNTYAWFLTLRDGKVVRGIAFFDSIALNELWDTVIPA